ncbi:Hsp20/alpha crystallin family protein [Paralcaligenes ureilyticus]|uniref:HSP20 family molecular chaperone IbpA n=1 Tax=Paralcaligenes ureilyticus TaxID=627131 RepID=A0A4R3M115_9BURK|nr:Hsp20/alpha crystallin family protein [Paralcaligenes ureilyticus]TCT06306.1 HSP20 family molecular chaperone IbpA [Paralcaligenes ureilyticus]
MNDTTAITRNEQASHAARTRAEAAQRSDEALMPPVDVIEDSTGITLRADLPGVPKDGLKLQVEAGTLTIEGDVSIPMLESMEATYVEVGLPRFRRVFTLSKELDTSKVSAELKHGVLNLRIPKAEHAQPRRIDIKVN